MISTLADFKSLTPIDDEDAAFFKVASSWDETNFLFWIDFPILDCDSPYRQRKIVFVRQSFQSPELNLKTKEGVLFTVFDANAFMEKIRSPRYNRFLFLPSSDWTFFLETAIELLVERNGLLSKDFSVEYFNEAVQTMRLVSTDFLSPDDVKRAHLTASEAFSFIDFSIDVLSKRNPSYLDPQRRPFYRDINSVFYEFDDLLADFQNKKEFCKSLHATSDLQESSAWQEFFQWFKKLLKT